MSREVMQQALEALDSYHGYMEPLTTLFGGPRVPAEQSTTGKVEKAITALRQALEQPADEPVAWKLNVDVNNYQGQSEYRTVLAFRPDPVVTGNYEVKEVISAQPLYTRPQAREPLTDEQCEDAIRTSGLWPLACVTPQNKALLIGLCRAAHGIKEKNA